MITAVTGASGHIGANLVRALLARGDTVRVLLHVNNKALDGLNVQFIDSDVCDPTSLLKAFDGADVVYHLAARISLSMNDWPIVQKINVHGTQNVVEACIRCRVHRLVHFSSIHAHIQEPLDVPIDESRPLVESFRCPPYDRSKADGEREVLKGIERGLDAIIVNPTGVIGPNDYQPSYFGRFLLALAHRKLPVLVSGGFNWVDARDVVAGAMSAQEKAQTGAKYLLSGHWASVSDLGDMIAEVTEVRIPRLVCPIWLAPLGTPFATAFARATGTEPIYTSVSLKALNSNQRIGHDKATRELGYKPRPLRVTLKDTLIWFKEHGKLVSVIKSNSYD